VVLSILAAVSPRVWAQDRYEFAHRQMGTTFRVILYAPDSARAQRAAAAAFRRIDTLNAILSDYREDSELSRLSGAAGSGRRVKVSRDFWRVLRAADQGSRKSSGAFDLTVGPLVQLWRRARRQHELPTPEAIARAKAATGYAHIQYYPLLKAVRLQKPGMRLDAGGIGKGYAVDEALKVLRRHGVQSALVDGGGNLALGAPPPGKRGWRIQIGAVDGDTSHAIAVALHHVGVSTSGDQYQYVEIDGQRYSHIVDPQTGTGLVNQCTVSVIARNGTEADWLSTAASVLGPARSLRLAKKVRKAKLYILQPVRGGYQRVSSPGIVNRNS